MGVRAWSTEEEDKLIILYHEEKDIEKVAKQFGKGHRNIISKLVSLKIYEKPVKEEKTTRTVKTMLRELEEMLDIQIEGFNLNKKSNLEILVDATIKKLKSER